MLNIVEEMREKRHEKGISQRQLAEIVGVSRSHICSIENGRSLPGSRLRLELFRALGVSFYAYGRGR